jgi:lipopolysaccharide biosynthesis glycosyltransferase
MSKIQIVSACDDNYVQHLAVMLCSLLENTENSKNISINIIDGGILEENKTKLDKFIYENYHIDMCYLTIDRDLYQDFPISYHFSHTIYYRISIPLLFDDSVDKVLYLDSDIVVKDDISKLWNTDLNNYLLAAVESPSFEAKYFDLNMPENSKYFNSGVLLINVLMWRKYNITEKTINFIQSHQDKITWWDQDSLNSILCNKWLPLSLRWNQQAYFFEKKHYQKHNYNPDFIEAIDNPGIIHFSSLHKPSEYINNHPYKYEYFYYLKLTPWKNFKPQVNFKIYLENIVRNYLPEPFFQAIKSIYKYLDIKKNKFQFKTHFLSFF